MQSDFYLFFSANHSHMFNIFVDLEALECTVRICCFVINNILKLKLKTSI